MSEVIQPGKITILYGRMDSPEVQTYFKEKQDLPVSLIETLEALNLLNVYKRVMEGEDVNIVTDRSDVINVLRAVGGEQVKIEVASNAPSLWSAYHEEACSFFHENAELLEFAYYLRDYATKKHPWQLPEGEEADRYQELRDTLPPLSSLLEKIQEELLPVLHRLGADVYENVTGQKLPYSRIK